MISNIHLPKPADKIVVDFAEKISRIEPALIDAIYITDSLPMNDFYSNKSDIDFIVLCKSLPGKKIASQLKSLHKSIAKHHPKPDLSGSYITSESISTCKYDNIKTLTWHEGKMQYGTLEMGAISLAELKTNSITVLGDKGETLPVEINNNVINKFLHNNINSYWRRWVSQHKRKILLFLFPRLTEWAVLGVARQLCTLHTGKIVSKTEAGFYCLQQLPVKYHPIIKEAIEIRKDNSTSPILGSYAVKPSFRRLVQTIDCVNYIITAFNKEYSDSFQNSEIK